MSFSTLVPTDGSPQAELAIRLATRLSRGDSVTLLHVVPPGGAALLATLDEASTLVTGAPGVLVEEWARHREKAALAILEAGRRAVIDLDPAIALHTDHAVGPPADVILDRLDSGRFALAVLGSHGRGLVARTLLGSVVAEVLEHARAAVLVARRESVRSIVLGVDGSASSLRAARYAGALARATGAAIDLLYAIEFPIDTYGSARSALEHRFSEESDRLFDAAVREAGVAEASRAVAFHEPAQALIVKAERAGTDLVVVGRRSRQEGARGTLGSVSRRVALGAGASVLVVP